MPVLCSTHPMPPLHLLQGTDGSNPVLISLDPLSLSGAHHLSSCLGSEELCWLLMSLWCRREGDGSCIMQGAARSRCLSWAHAGLEN